MCPKVIRLESHAANLNSPPALVAQSFRHARDCRRFPRPRRSRYVHPDIKLVRPRHVLANGLLLFVSTDNAIARVCQAQERLERLVRPNIARIARVRTSALADITAHPDEAYPLRRRFNVEAGKGA